MKTGNTNIDNAIYCVVEHLIQQRACIVIVFGVVYFFFSEITTELQQRAGMNVLSL